MPNSCRQPSDLEPTLCIAACAQQHASVAVAACAFAIPAPNAERLVEVQVTPAGVFRPRDGRSLPMSGWRIDRAIARRVIDRFAANATPLVVDYEHQTLLNESNGQPAPAAGFFRSLEWRDGVGLFATVELTARAAEFVRADEYRYFSPVFSFDPHTGAVLALQMGALTNNPALDGMQPLALRAAARFGLDINQETPMDLIAEIRKLLGLSADATDAAIIESLRSKLGADPAAADAVAQLRSELGVAADAGTAAVIAACRALKTSTAPDPSQFVPIDAMQEMRAQLAALTAQTRSREVEDLVVPALADGHLLPLQAAWARDLGASNIAKLKSYLGTVQPFAALAGSQTGGNPPDGAADGSGLTADEIAVCTATGVDPVSFAKTKKAA